MTKRTAEKVADLLGLVEAYLEAGRPRKAPGKPRPEAVDLSGKVVKATNDRGFWYIDKVSLPGAFRIAAREQGYTRNVQEWAGCALFLACDSAYKIATAGTLYGVLQQIDDEEQDTRLIRRHLRRARRRVERNFL